MGVNNSIICVITIGKYLMMDAPQIVVTKDAKTPEF